MDKKTLKDYFLGKLRESEAKEAAEWLAEHGSDTDLDQVFMDLFSESMSAEPVAGTDRKFMEICGNLGIVPEREGRKRLQGRGRAAIWICSGIAAVFASAVVLLGISLGKTTEKLDTVWKEFYVPVGATADLTLSDGTVLKLNSASRITYPESFVGKTRDIFVDGEVYAEVAKDPSRPFFIHSGEILVSVLGTEFDFKSYPASSCVELFLLEGAVCFDVDNGKHRINMEPGELLQYSRNTGTVDIKRFSTASYRSFADNGSLNFYNLTLKDIADELGRLFGTRIVVTDDDLAKSTYFAIFSNNETLEQILMALNADNQIVVERKNDVILLSSNRKSKNPHNVSLNN